MKNTEKKQNVLVFITHILMQKSLLLVVFVLLLLGASPVSAQEESSDKAEFGFEAYMWAATIKQTTATGDRVVITFGDIVKNLDFTAMIRGTVQKDRFFGAADVIYLGISDSQRHKGEFLGQPVTGKLEVGIKSWVLNLIGGYELLDSDVNRFGVTAGARYLDLTLDTTVKIEDLKRKESSSGSGWDGVVGFRGRHNYDDGHYLNYYADVGGGNAKLTWQAMANFSYDFKKFTGIAGYRYLKWNFKNDAPAVDDMTIHGPYLGIKWTW
ncbi:MAG: hypothetical protein WBM36_08555 [Lysobacterales bacterium]